MFSVLIHQALNTKENILEAMKTFENLDDLKKCQQNQSSDPKMHQALKTIIETCFDGIRI